jgi:hypothetical protein
MIMLQLTRRSLSSKQFLAQKSIIEIQHSLYTPDLAPNDFWLFPKIVCLKGTKISGYSRLSKNVTTVLKAMHNRNSKNIPNSGNITGLSTELLKREGGISKLIPLSKLYVRLP